jgi:hypothetical protein
VTLSVAFPEPNLQTFTLENVEVVITVN